MKKNEIVSICKKLGCCDACCLRYIGLKSPIAYENSNKYVLKYQETPDSESDAINTVHNVLTPSSEETTDTNHSHNKTSATDHIIATRAADPGSNEDMEPVIKKHKTDHQDSRTSGVIEENTLPSEADIATDVQAGGGDGVRVCVSCIGVLQEESLEECVRMAKEELEKKRYSCSRFACALSAPLVTLWREHRLALRLQEAAPHYDTKTLVPLKEAWKWSVGARMQSAVGMELDSGSVAPLLITCHLDYQHDVQELEELKRLAPEYFAARNKQRRRFAVEFTRRSVEEALAQVTAARLGGDVTAGGERWGSERAACVSVTCVHTPLYLAGRYIKLSRTLPQTPWFVNGVRMADSSVQETIFGPIADMCGISTAEMEHRMKLITAGREDVDVRCLGDGRPFAIEISDPRRELTAAELQTACERISHGDSVRVKQLLYIPKEHLVQLKKGEQSKCKTYDALCIKLQHAHAHADSNCTTNGEGETCARVTQQDIDNINAYTNTAGVGEARIVLQQRTPIRVLHRRPLLTRTRSILELSASLVPGHPQLLAVRVSTEAGTYIKEWVHGELGRTAPSLAAALPDCGAGAALDILALDVAAVHLDWPIVNKT